MARDLGRIERRLVEALEALRGQGWPSAPTELLAVRVFGAAPTVAEKASLARAVRSLVRKGRVEVLPGGVFGRRRRQVRLVDVDP